MDWMTLLRTLGPDQVFVQHVPMTARYGRAAQKLRYLLRESSFLGLKAMDDHRDAVEIATWAPSPDGRGYGYYTCFRVFMYSRQPSAAVLFCFYDGTDKSPGFKSIDAAKAYAAVQGFGESDEQDD